MRHTLVVAEVALSVVLVVGAVLLIRSFFALYDQGPGFRPEKLFALYVRNSSDYVRSANGLPANQDLFGRSIRESGEWIRSASQTFRREVLPEVAAIPGVEAVTWGRNSTTVPPNNDGSSYLFNLTLKEQRGRRGTESAKAISKIVEPGYFRVMGISLLKGRLFGPQDRRDSLRVGIVSQKAARRFWPGQDPLGKQLRWANEEDWVTVVGVVGDVRDDGMNKPPQPNFYIPLPQGPQGIGGILIVQTSMEIGSLMPVIRERIRSVDAGSSLRGPLPIEQMVRDSAWRLNYSMLLLTGLGALSFLLALVGVYGVLSWSVRERIREMGLRMALGAERIHLFWLVIRQGLGLAAIGVMLGLFVAGALTHFMGSLLYGVKPLDPLTFMGVALAQLLAAGLASFIPARRATKLDPLRALRYE